MLTLSVQLACLPVQPPLTAGGHELLLCWDLWLGVYSVGFFSFFFFFPVKLSFEMPKLPTDILVRGFPGVWKLFLLHDSLPRTGLHPLLFCLSFYLLYSVLLPFEENGLPFWVPGVHCQHSEVVLWNLSKIEQISQICSICSVFNWSFDEFVGKKVISPSYSSAILGSSSIFVFFWLTYFALYNNLQVHPCCYKWHYFVLFKGKIIFHCIYLPHLYLYICWWTSRLLSGVGYCK